MESSVEDANLRQTRHKLAYSLYALEVCRVVERSKVAALLEHLQYLFVKYHALVELLASVHHAVTHGVYFLQVFDGSNLGVCQQAEDKLHSLGMLGDVVHHLPFLAVGQLHLYKSTVKSHAFSSARCHDRVVVHVVQRVLY